MRQRVPRFNFSNPFLDLPLHLICKMRTQFHLIPENFSNCRRIRKILFLAPKHHPIQNWRGKARFLQHFPDWFWDVSVFISNTAKNHNSFITNVRVGINQRPPSGIARRKPLYWGFGVFLVSYFLVKRISVI